MFALSNTGNSIALNLANGLEESDILGKQIFELTIQATIGTIKGFAALVITIEQEECIEVTEILLFLQPLYTHSFLWANGLSIPQVILSPESYQPDVIFELESGMLRKYYNAIKVSKIIFFLFFWPWMLKNI